MKPVKAIPTTRSEPDSIIALLGPGGPWGGFGLGPAWIERIRAGLPGEAVTTLASKLSVPRKEVAGWLHTTPRTLQRHIDTHAPLSPELSDRVAQLLRVYLRAKEVFQSESKATIWLKSPNYVLGDIAPTTLLDTIPGIELVLDELGRIEHGIFI